MVYVAYRMISILCGFTYSYPVSPITTKFAAFFVFDFSYSVSTSRFFCLGFEKFSIVILATPSFSPFTGVSIPVLFAGDLLFFAPKALLVAVACFFSQVSNPLPELL